MKNRAFHVFYLYGIYVTYLSYYLMVFNYFTNFYEPTAFPFILSLFLSGTVHYYLMKFFGGRAKVFSIIIVSPIAIAILYQFQIPWLASLIGLGFAYRGIFTIIIEGESFNKSSLLAKSLGIGLFAVILGAGNPNIHDPSPYIVLIIQFFLFFGGYFLANWLEAKGDGRRKGAYISQFAIILGIVFLISFIFSLFMKPIRQVVFYSFTLMLKPFVFFLGPFIQWLIGVFEGWFNRKPPQTETEFDIEQPVDEAPVIEMAEPSDFMMPLLYIISILVALIIFFRLFKGKKDKLEKVREEIFPVLEERTSVISKMRSKTRQTPPSMIPVRKAMFDFERKAEKYHKERKKGETIQEWFDRIGLEDFSIIPIYEMVRYGDQRISENKSQKFLLFLQSTLSKWKDEFSMKNKGESGGEK